MIQGNNVKYKTMAIALNIRKNFLFIFYTTWLKNIDFFNLEIIVYNLFATA